MSMKIKMDSRWQDTLLSGIEAGQLDMVTDIHRRSNMLAPVDTSAMINSSLIKKIGRLALSITYGNSKVPYARRQFFENRTKSHYLSKAAESVMRGNLSKYFRGRI